MWWSYRLKTRVLGVSLGSARGGEAYEEERENTLITWSSVVHVWTVCRSPAIRRRGGFPNSDSFCTLHSRSSNLDQFTRFLSLLVAASSTTTSTSTATITAIDGKHPMGFFSSFFYMLYFFILLARTLTPTSTAMATATTAMMARMTTKVIINADISTMPQATRHVETAMAAASHRNGGEGGYGQVVGPNYGRLGQVWFFFFFQSSLFTNIYLLFTRQQAYGPTLASKASRWAVLWLTNSTLATIASWWGFLLLFNIRTHPRYKRESVGRFHTRNHPRTPPSLQTRVGGVFFKHYIYMDPPSLQTESVGHFHARTRSIPHPCSERKSVGLIVLFMQCRRGSNARTFFFFFFSYFLLSYSNFFYTDDMPSHHSGSQYAALARFGCPNVANASFGPLVSSFFFSSSYSIMIIITAKFYNSRGGLEYAAFAKFGPNVFYNANYYN